MSDRTPLRRMTLTSLAGLLCALAFVPGTSAQQKHPDYLHALADMRMARSYVASWPTGKLHEGQQEGQKEILGDIDAAIDELKKASIDDGKSLNDHPPIDANLFWNDDLRRARELLQQARKDAGQQEDDLVAAKLQSRVLHHINKAIRRIDEVRADNN